MKIDLLSTSAMLKGADDILILAHASPDGDTLGGGFALCRALQKMGKRVNFLCGDEIPPKYGYLYKDIIFTEMEPKFIVSVDVADTKLLGKEVEEKYGDNINLCIDHHGSNLFYAKNTFLDPSSASACEMVYDLVKALGVEVDSKMADCIYTGISTDTGCFRYSNTTAKTLRYASEMVEAGAQLAEINRVMFEVKTKSYAKLERLALETMAFYYDERCVIVKITQDMYEESGSSPSESEGIVALTRQVEGVVVGALMREKKDGGFKVSVRTFNPIDAAAICAKMGGGGHPRAAGCAIDEPYDKALDILIKNIGEALEEQA